MPFLKPYAKDVRRPREPLEMNLEKRIERLEQPFSVEALPTPSIDAIVIGSGLAGLMTAGILAKTGRKVVVLEKAAKVGGYCQSFNRDGYEWDVSIHYAGLMGPNDFERFIVDQLTEGQLDWARLADDFDNLVFVRRGETCLHCTTPFPEKVIITPIWTDRRRFLDELIRRYPCQETGLRRFFGQIVKLTSPTFRFFAYLKVVNMNLAKWLTTLGIHKFLTRFFTDFHEKTAKQRLDKLFGRPGEGNEHQQQDTKELKAILGQFTLRYDVEPYRAGAGLMGCAYDYINGGGYYPIGGASEIPYTLIPPIERTGGCVLVNANVTEILLESDTNNRQKAIGVRVGTDSGPVDIKAPLVISDVGVSNTFRRLLPKQVASQTKLGCLLESGRIHPSRGIFQVFAAIKGSQEDVQLPAKNIWLLYELDIDKAIVEWLSLDLEKTAVIKTKIPFLFVSSSSAKDPTYNDRFPGRSVFTMFTVAPVEWFRKWENSSPENRSRDYVKVKQRLANACWELVVDRYPELADRLDFLEAATPLTTARYVNTCDGEPFGLESDTERFCPEVAIALRPKVDEIKNLFLTGQDVLMTGFVGCLYSALLTCQAVMKPLGECSNLISDAKHLYENSAPGTVGNDSQIVVIDDPLGETIEQD